MRQEFRTAVIRGDEATVERLLRNGEPVNGRDRFGQTALMLAARHGHKPIVDLLIACGSDLDVTGKYGLSALMLAVVNGHTDVALALIEAKANTSLKGTGAPGFAGKTAKDLARARGLSQLVNALADSEHHSGRERYSGT